MYVCSGSDPVATLEVPWPALKGEEGKRLARSSGCTVKGRLPPPAAGRVRLHDTWNRALKVLVAGPGAELKVHWFGLDRPGPVYLQNLQNSTGNGNGVSNLTLQCCSASRETSRSRPAAAAVTSLGLSAHLFRHQQRWMGDASDLLCSSQPQIPYHQHIVITDISSFYCTLRPRP
jgi:hypothetical protein